MTTDHAIYLKVNLKRVGTGPQPGQVRSEANYLACYGPQEAEGANRRQAAENMIRTMRRMAANGGLIDAQIQVPVGYEDCERLLIPASVLSRDVSDFIDWDEIEQENSEV